MNTAQYSQSVCGKSITISYNGNTAVASVEDECPGCSYGSLDMSEGLFTHFAVGPFLKPSYLGSHVLMRDGVE